MSETSINNAQLQEFANDNTLYACNDSNDTIYYDR